MNPEGIWNLSRDLHVQKIEFFSYFSKVMMCVFNTLFTLLFLTLGYLMGDMVAVLVLLQVCNQSSETKIDILLQIIKLRLEHMSILLFFK